MDPISRYSSCGTVFAMNSGSTCEKRVTNIAAYNSISPEVTELSRFAPIAKAFPASSTPDTNVNRTMNVSISDILRSAKRSNFSMSSNPMISLAAASNTPGMSGLSMPPLLHPRLNLASSTAVTANTSAIGSSLISAGAGRPSKRPKLDHASSLLSAQKQASDSDHNTGDDDDVSNEEEEDDSEPSPQLDPEQPDQLQQQDGAVRFREYQAEIWSEKFEELCMFRRQHGHCHVPHHFEENQGLAQWVKRQRYQYKLKAGGKRSTLSDERVRLLNKIGFIWNSHDAVWEERLQDLTLFKRIHGHCLVPSNFEPNVQLAIWTKRQRREYKKYQDGGASSMTSERIAKLEAVGFVWDCRKTTKKDQIPQQEQQLLRDIVAMAGAAAGPNTAGGTTTAAMNNVLLAHQQQQIRMMQNSLQNQLRNSNVQEAVSYSEGDKKPRSGQDTNEPNNEGKAATTGQVVQKNDQIPLRLPRCEFFSFSCTFRPR